MVAQKVTSQWKKTMRINSFFLIGTDKLFRTKVANAYYWNQKKLYAKCTHDLNSN